MPKSIVPVVSVTVPSALKVMPANSFAGARGDFKVGADAEPAQPAALAALALAAGEALAVGKFERLLGQRGEVADVEGRSRRGLERQLLRADLVAPAQRHRIDAHFGCGRVDQPLHIIVALGPAGAAIGGDLRWCW